MEGALLTTRAGRSSCSSPAGPANGCGPAQAGSGPAGRSCRSRLAALTTATSEERIERQLWGLAGQALADAPTGSAPRLYVETLNEMFDAETARVAALSNRVPTAVLVLEVLGSAIALGLLAAYLAIAGRGVIAVLLASALVAFLLLVTADLDRPTRGMIVVPDTALTNQLASMTEPPAATAPRSP